MAQFMTPSGTPPNLYYINCSAPSSISELEWEKWFTLKHLPALLESGLVSRAALYKEVSFAMLPNPSHPLQYMILYHTRFARLQDSEKYHLVLDQTGAGRFYDDEENDLRNYKLIQDYNPFRVADSPGPQLLTVEMRPEDREDFEDWYRNELLPKVGSLPGYRRCKRYQIATTKGEANHYLAIHELDNLSRAFRSQTQHEERTTPRTEKHIEASEKSQTDRGSGFVRRGWTLVYDEGYQMKGGEIQINSKKCAREESETASDYGGCSGLRRILLRLFGSEK